MPTDIVIQRPCDAGPADASLCRWARLALGGREAGELVLRIVDTEESRALNARYRKRDAATNVLSFPAEMLPGVDDAPLGDLVICAPVVAAEAEQQNKSAEAHWAHMVIHGCLHLLGFDHQTEAQAAVMEALETGYLAQLNFPDPYETLEQ